MLVMARPGKMLDFHFYVSNKQTKNWKGSRLGRALLLLTWTCQTHEQHRDSGQAQNPIFALFWVSMWLRRAAFTCVT